MNAPVQENLVSTPARLVSRAPLAYPPAARAAQIETDVRVEIIVDAAGRVVSARPLTDTGYGLDDAAVRAVRGYRFSPATKDGRAVAVRMRWTVQFRLD
jgi:protein TonB